MPSSDVQSIVAEKLADAEPINQDEFVNTIKSEYDDITPNDVLLALRNLMIKDKVCYTIDWRLQLQNTTN